MVREGIVEFHGFRDNNGQFIVKELALVSDDKRYTHIFFKPPFLKTELDQHHQRMVDWCERNLHRIQWEYGDIDFSEDIMKTLCGYFDTVYTKGTEKTRYLQQFHNNVINLPDTAPKTKFGYNNVRCPVHIDNGPCALHTAILLMEWLKLQKDVVRESVRLDSFNNSTVVPTEERIRLAKAGFYFDSIKNKVVCAWCNDFYNWHIGCVSYYVNNIPTEYDVILPRI